MLILKVLIVFTILTAIDYIVSVRKNPFYNKLNNFVASSTRYVNSKIN